MDTNCLLCKHYTGNCSISDITGIDLTSLPVNTSVTACTEFIALEVV